jgi:hypothetical protein
MEGKFLDTAPPRPTCMEQQSRNVRTLTHQGQCFDDCLRAVSHGTKENIPNDKKGFVSHLYGGLQGRSQKE